MAESKASASGRSRGSQRSSRISSSPPNSCPIWRSSWADRHWCQPCCTGAPPRSISMAGPMISCSAWPPPTVPRAVSAVSTSSAPGERGVAPRQPVTMAVTAELPCRSVRHSSRIRSFMAHLLLWLAQGAGNGPQGAPALPGLGGAKHRRPCGPSLCANPANVNYSRVIGTTCPRLTAFMPVTLRITPSWHTTIIFSAWPSYRRRQPSTRSAMTA